MKTSTTNLIAILTVAAVAMATSSASAGGFSFGGGKGGGKGGGNKGGSFKMSLGGGNHNHKHHNHHGHKKFHHGHHHGHHKFHHKYYHYPVKRYYQPSYVVYDQCYEPYWSYCIVQPGDTWYTISKRCYGNSSMWKHIASYNSLGTSSSALVAGQQLQLPVVNTDGSLGASSAPAPQFAPQQPASLPAAPAAETTPAAAVRTIDSTPQRPTVAMGSTLSLESQSFGSEEGSVRLRISGLALPVEVIEWNNGAIKVQLPTMELTGPTNADLEVLQADGSMASTSAIQLTPATTRLALGN